MRDEADGGIDCCRCSMPTAEPSNPATGAALCRMRLVQPAWQVHVQLGSYGYGQAIAGRSAD